MCSNISSRCSTYFLFQIFVSVCNGRRKKSALGQKDLEEEDTDDNQEGKKYRKESWRDERDWFGSKGAPQPFEIFIIIRCEDTSASPQPYTTQLMTHTRLVDLCGNSICVVILRYNDEADIILVKWSASNSPQPAAIGKL